MVLRRCGSGDLRGACRNGRAPHPGVHNLVGGGGGEVEKQTKVRNGLRSTIHTH